VEVKVKILGIMGAPTKANTEIALEECIRGAEEVSGVETEIWSVVGKKLNPCQGDYLCYTKGTWEKPCGRWDDDINKLFPKVYEADGIIWATPVYNLNVSAQLKIVMDRLITPSYASWPSTGYINKNPYKRFFKNKMALAIAVAGGRTGGQDMAINAINSMMLYPCEMLVVGGAATQDLEAATIYPACVSGAQFTTGIPPMHPRYVADAVKDDKIGLDAVRYAGKRFAEVLKIWKTGLTHTEGAK